MRGAEGAEGAEGEGGGRWYRVGGFGFIRL